MTSNQSSPTQAEKIAFRRQAIRTMKEQLEQTLSLVQSHNYREAKTSFEKAKKTWFTFGGTIKRIAPDLYEIMDPSIKTANTLLNQVNPQQHTLNAELQTLNQAAAKAVVVSDAQD